MKKNIQRFEVSCSTRTVRNQINLIKVFILSKVLSTNDVTRKSRFLRSPLAPTRVPNVKNFMTYFLAPGRNIFKKWLHPFKKHCFRILSRQKIVGPPQASLQLDQKVFFKKWRHLWTNPNVIWTSKSTIKNSIYLWNSTFANSTLQWSPDRYSLKIIYNTKKQYKIRWSPAKFCKR